MKIVMACICDAHDGFLTRSLTTHLTYPWVDEIVLLNSGDKPFELTTPRVTLFNRNFGSSWDRQPEDGGYDEVGAKNYLTSLLREQHNDAYIILMDTDDIFHPKTIDIIHFLARSGRSSAVLECWHFTTPTTYLFFPHGVYPYGDGSPRMHDPHLRITRPGIHLQWELNQNVELRNTWQNRTMHCVPQPPAGWADVERMPGLFHLHTHHMFEPKRTKYATTHKKDWELRQLITSPFPPPILTAYAEQETAYPDPRLY